MMAMKCKYDWLRIAEEIKSISQNGLAYCKNPYDKERYHQLKAIAADIISNHSNFSQEKILDIFSHDQGYLTPKLDVRAAIFKMDKILLVKEISDGLWTLPGGWVDINESPAEAAIRETCEETGYIVKVLKLAALWDKHKHGHPPQIPHAYKAMFICTITEGISKTNHETSDIGWYGIDALPDLSLHRVMPNQILRLYEHSTNPDIPTDFD